MKNMWCFLLSSSCFPLCAYRLRFSDPAEAGPVPHRPTFKFTLFY